MPGQDDTNQGHHLNFCQIAENNAMLCDENVGEIVGNEEY